MKRPLHVPGNICCSTLSRQRDLSWRAVGNIALKVKSPKHPKPCIDATRWHIQGCEMAAAMDPLPNEQLRPTHKRYKVWFEEVEQMITSLVHVGVGR